MNNQFGLSIVFDHDFITLPLLHKPVGVEGPVVLHLPCGSVPTALMEYTHQGERVTEITMLVPGCEALTWTLALSALDVQKIFREGSHKINRIPGGDLGNVKPFDPS